MRSIKAIDTLTYDERELLAEVRTVILSLVPAAMIALYGSVARGTRTPDSDVDIIVFTESPLTWKEQEAIYAAVSKVDVERNILVSVTFFDRARWEEHQRMPFVREVQRDGVLI